jgi:hypothetical protein
MSNIDNYFNEQPPASGPDFTSKPHSWFAYVIDGEVAWIHVIPKEVEHFHSVLSSNPTIVEIPVELTDDVQLGWLFNGSTFTNPG